MSERDKERLGNLPVRELKIPTYWAETRSKAKPPRITREPEPTLPENSARLHNYTEITKLFRITFAENLILPEENGSESFWFVGDKFKGFLLFHLYSFKWPEGRARLIDKPAFPIHPEIIREWDVKPGLYYAVRNTKLRSNVECKYDERFCYSKGQDGICKRGVCYYHSGEYNDKENIWHIGIDFNKPLKI